MMIFDEDIDDLEAPVLSSVVVDEDDIDFDIDLFEHQDISMFPAVPLSQSQQVLARLKEVNLKLNSSKCTWYHSSRSCCHIRRHYC